MTIDRYDASVALQLWQRFFLLALDAGVVSNKEETWLEHRISALEYLARGKLMAICSLFFDGPVAQEPGDIDLYQAAQRGVAVAFGAGDEKVEVAEAAYARMRELTDVLDQAERELEKLLADRCAYLASHGPAAIALELARVPELTPQHRIWLQSPIAAARGAVVAAELERPLSAMPPTSSAPGEHPPSQGFNPAFFPAEKPLFAIAKPSSPAPQLAAPSSAAEPAPAESPGFNPAFFPAPEPAMVGRPAPEPEPETSAPSSGFNPAFFPAPKPAIAGRPAPEPSAAELADPSAPTEPASAPSGFNPAFFPAPAGSSGRAPGRSKQPQRPAPEPDDEPAE